MKIAIAGGLGLEKELASALKGHQLTIIGTAYDCGSEKFAVVSGVEFVGEYVTHNYVPSLSGYDFLIDCSENLKSKHLLNEISVKENKPYLTLFYKDGWQAFYRDGSPEGACLSCISSYEKPKAPYLINNPNPEVFVPIAAKVIADQPEGALQIGLESADSPAIPVLRTNSCNTHHAKYLFLNGQMADVSSVSCSDNSVSISPMNEFTIDLKSCREELSKSVKITKETPFFVEFKVCHLSCLLFRQGRLVVKGSKEKNTAYFLYRRYVGS